MKLTGSPTVAALANTKPRREYTFNRWAEREACSRTFERLLDLAFTGKVDFDEFDKDEVEDLGKLALFLRKFSCDQLIASLSLELEKLLRRPNLPPAAPLMAFTLAAIVDRGEIAVLALHVSRPNRQFRPTTWTDYQCELLSRSPYLTAIIRAFAEVEEEDRLDFSRMREDDDYTIPERFARHLPGARLSESPSCIVRRLAEPKTRAPFHGLEEASEHGVHNRVSLLSVVFAPTLLVGLGIYPEVFFI